MMRTPRWIVMVLGLAASLGVSAIASAAGQISVYAAGSLRAPLTEAAQAYELASGVKVVLLFGASGLLKERIEKGEIADVFASANTEHPQALADSGRMATPVTFTRNQMCALAAPAIAATSETLLEHMLQGGVKLGTSTPKADPSGDYAWKIFEKAEKVSPGAYASLSAKALKLTGGPDSPPPPKDRSGYGELVATGKADIFLLYCTSAVQAVREQPQLRQIALPRSLAVWADYGVAIAKNASASAQGFVDYLVSDAGQKSFARFGFTRVAGSRLTIQLPSGQVREISLADIQKLEPFKVSAKTHGKSHEWQGTKLLTLLESAGHQVRETLWRRRIGSPVPHSGSGRRLQSRICDGRTRSHHYDLTADGGVAPGWQTAGRWRGAIALDRCRGSAWRAASAKDFPYHRWTD